MSLANLEIAAENSKSNRIGFIVLHGMKIVTLLMEGHERLCLAQISNTLLKEFSYNEIHNRRVALGITCIQCTPVQLEILRRAGAMPVTSRRCGMITKREAERLVKSFLDETSPPQLPENFVFDVMHDCGWGCEGQFIPSRYNSSRAKCIQCNVCKIFFSPNKFIFHFHANAEREYRHPDAANFNSWRRHIKLASGSNKELQHIWEDVKSMFNGGSRKRIFENNISDDSTYESDKVKSLKVEENKVNIKDNCEKDTPDMNEGLIESIEGRQSHEDISKSLLTIKYCQNNEKLSQDWPKIPMPSFKEVSIPSADNFTMGIGMKTDPISKGFQNSSNTEKTNGGRIFTDCPVKYDEFEQCYTPDVYLPHTTNLSYSSAFTPVLKTHYNAEQNKLHQILSSSAEDYHYHSRSLHRMSENYKAQQLLSNVFNFYSKHPPNISYSLSLLDYANRISKRISSVDTYGIKN